MMRTWNFIIHARLNYETRLAWCPWTFVKLGDDEYFHFHFYFYNNNNSLARLLSLSVLLLLLLVFA